MKRLDHCCSPENECDQFESDCDDDYDCKQGLICKQNACATGFGNDIDYDCCWKRKYISSLPTCQRANHFFGTTICGKKNEKRKLVCISLTTHIVGDYNERF